jgi:hypothetical protein
MSKSFPTTPTNAQAPEKRYRKPLDALSHAIELANAASMDLGALWFFEPRAWAWMFRQDPDGARTQAREAVEKLKGTQFYVPGGLGITLSKYGEARHIREMLLRIARAASGVQRQTEVRKRNAPEVPAMPKSAAGTGVSVNTTGSCRAAGASGPARAGTGVTVNTARRRTVEIPLPFVHSLPVVRVGTDGQITVREQRVLKYKPMLDALGGLDARRIRQCPQCRAIFWACKSDKLVCSPACRARKFRRANPDKHNMAQYRYEQAHPDRKKRLEHKQQKPQKPVTAAKTIRGSSIRTPRLPGSKRKRVSA